MSVRRFTGATARDALRQVREALGPDALIVSNRPIEGGVEVLAMNDAGAATLAADASTSGSMVAHVGNALAGDAATKPVNVAAAADNGAQVLGAIGAMRGALENRIDGILWGEQLRRVPVGIAVFRALLAAGFSAPLARALTHRIPTGVGHEQAMAWLHAELARNLPVQADDRGLLAGGGVFALVGPTGVGKTTTTAKLAARCVLKYGAGKVAMLTTDSYRIGAHEQLLIYGRILGVPVHPANDADALRRALHNLGGKHIILIDTVGMSQRDQNVAEQAAMLFAAGRPVRRLLLLNAASNGDTLDEVAHAYRQEAAGPLMGCVITKLDEAVRPGAALDVAIRHRMPIHYVCGGQQVPEHIVLPQPTELVDRALAAARDTVLFSPTEADFAAMWTLAGRSIDKPDSAPRPASAPPGNMPVAHFPTQAAVSADAPALMAADSGQLALSSAKRQRKLRVVVAGAGGCQAEFDSALAALLRLRCFTLAHQVWREHADGHAPAELADSMLADVRSHLGQTCNHHLLAVHGRLRPPTPGRAGAEAWRHAARSLLFSDRGVALAAPVTHVHTPHGLSMSFSDTVGAPGSATTAVLARADWLAGQLPRERLVHVFDGFSMALAATLEARDMPWLARCPASQWLIFDGARMTAGGLSKVLGYAPAGAVQHNGRQCHRWVAAAEVVLPGQRRAARDAQAARFVAARLIDDATGDVVAQAMGLADCGLTASAQVLADWLALVDAARASHDWARAVADPLVAVGRATAGAEAVSTNAGIVAGHLLAGQLGLLGRQLAEQHPKQAAVVLGLQPGRSRAAQRVFLDGVMRLFAALDMTMRSVA